VITNTCLKTCRHFFPADQFCCCVGYSQSQTSFVLNTLEPRLLLRKMNRLSLSSAQSSSRTLIPTQRLLAHKHLKISKGAHSYCSVTERQCLRSSRNRKTCVDIPIVLINWFRFTKTKKPRQVHIASLLLPRNDLLLFLQIFYKTEQVRT